jgi:hypothetical protein
MRIQKGDKVKIHLYTDRGLTSFKGVVCHVACATGDSWGIYAINGTINYVQQFTVMTKITWGDKDITEQWYVSTLKKIGLK